MSCSHYFLCFKFMVETVVSKTTKCHDFTVIFPVFFFKMYRDFAFFYRDFLTALININK